MAGQEGGVVREGKVAGQKTTVVSRCLVKVYCSVEGRWMCVVDEGKSTGQLGQIGRLGKRVMEEFKRLEMEI